MTILLEIGFGRILDQRMVCPSIGTLWSTWISGFLLHVLDQLCGCIHMVRGPENYGSWTMLGPDIQISL